MSGSARSLSIAMFAGLRVASTSFTPEYSKDGRNVSAKLVINAFENTASKATNGVVKKRESIQFTVWDKLAHICAKSMSPGKEWNCTAYPNVYLGRVFQPGAPGQPGTPVLMADGSPLMTKKFSFTIQQLTFGEESNKHIANEMQAMINNRPVRPLDWNVLGSAGAAEWKQTLLARQAVQFNPALPTYGYARIRMPQGTGISAYIPNAPAQAAAGPAVDTAAAVAATFTGVNPAEPTVAAPVVGQPVSPAPVVSPGGFVVPAGV